MAISFDRLRERKEELVRASQRVWDTCAAFAARVAFDRGRGSGANQAAAAPQSVDAWAPEGRLIYAIGDIHGRFDLLQRLVDIVRADADAAGASQPPVIIFLGDYVDRGFQSRDVIDFLLSDALAGFEPRFLKGNHESAMLEFLNNPNFGQRWAEYGGIETIVSYGVRPPQVRTNRAEWERVCDDFNAALPTAHRAFLHSLELMAEYGDYVFVHAGLRPGKPIAAQTEDDVLWIRETFLNDRAAFERVVVHGHTPSSAPHRDHRRIGLDTGAYMSGRLTAARLDENKVEFLATG